MGRKRSLVVLVAAGLSLGGCGSTAATPPGATGGGSTRPSATRPPPARPAAAPIGRTQRIKARGTTLAVAVSQVIDPLRGSGATLLSGTRAVGVIVRIHNRGPGDYDSSSTGDISIVPSSGAASASYASAGRCKTPDQDFDNLMSPGDTRTGCVLFTLNAGAQLRSVRFSANGGGGGVGNWQATPTTPPAGSGGA